MAVPAITSIAPSGGSVDGGTTVTITGTDLTTPTAVTFGGVAAASFSGASATQAFAVSPAGTGAVHIRLATAGGTSPEVAADTFTYGSPLFTVAEARAFDKQQLASSTDYTNAAIIAKEEEVRDFLARVCSVDFLPTTHTDEYQDGLGGSSLLLDWPLVTAVTAASIRSDTTWTDLTVTELGQLQVFDTGELYWDGGYWPVGRRNVKLTYTAGYTTVPDLIKRAALRIATLELPASNVPFSAESYDAGGMSVNFANGDGFMGHWHRDPEVMRAIRMFDHSLPGVA
jgi:hypothetical protein